MKTKWNLVSFRSIGTRAMIFLHQENRVSRTVRVKNLVDFGQQFYDSATFVSQCKVCVIGLARWSRGKQSFFAES